MLDVSLGTVKSRLMRGREALKKRLEPYVEEVGAELGLESPAQVSPGNGHAKPVPGNGHAKPTPGNGHAKPADAVPAPAVRVRQEVEIRP